MKSLRERMRADDGYQEYLRTQEIKKDPETRRLIMEMFGTLPQHYCDGAQAEEDAKMLRDFLPFPLNLAIRVARRGGHPDDDFWSYYDYIVYAGKRPRGWQSC